MDNYNQQQYGSQYNGQQPNYMQSSIPKKNGAIKILVIVLIIMMLMCCGGGGVFAFLAFKTAQPREALSESQLTNVLEDMGYKKDIKDLGVDYITNYITFINSETGGMVEFYETDTENDAQDGRDQFLLDFEYKDSSIKSSLSGGNYEYYKWRDSDDRQIVVYRVDKTLIVIVCGNKKEISNIVEALEIK